jgi:hypothetical protein
MTVGSPFAQLKSAYLNPDAWYSIIAIHCAKGLEIRDNSMKDHAPVQQNEAHGGDNQLFLLAKDPGSYRISARSSGYGFDVSDGVNATNSNVPVIVHPVSGSVYRTFKIVEAMPSPTPSPVAPPVNPNP